MLRYSPAAHYLQIFEIVRDFLLRIRDYPRRHIALHYGETNPQDLRLDDLLTHIPLQDWPLPDRDQCPVGFCKERVNRENLGTHLQQSHLELWNKGHYHSEFHMTLAGFLAMELESGDPDYIACPFPDCSNLHFSYQELLIHLSEAHSELTQLLYKNIGGFWTIVASILTSTSSIDSTNDLGFISWPTIGELFTDQDGTPIFNPFPVDPSRAHQLWGSHTDIDLQDYVPVNRSPLNTLLRDYIQYVSDSGIKARLANLLRSLSKNRDLPSAKYMAAKNEKARKIAWLRHQSQCNPASFKEIRNLTEFVFNLDHLSQPIAQSHRNILSIPSQNHNESQSEEEHNQIENYNQWISDFLSYSDEDTDSTSTQDSPHEISQEPSQDSHQESPQAPLQEASQDPPVDDRLNTITDILEHDNQVNEDRTPPERRPGKLPLKTPSLQLLALSQPSFV
jgi:hypothetical protein